MDHNKFLRQFQVFVLVIPILLRIIFWIYGEISVGSGFLRGELILEYMASLVWLVVPYVILGAISFKFQNMSSLLTAAAVMLVIETFAHFEVFVFPSSSTAGLIFIFLPIYQVVIFMPVGLFLGVVIGKVIDAISKKRQSV